MSSKVDNNPKNQNSRNSNKKKITISYVIRNENEPQNRVGVNSMQFDHQNCILYTAGRDSIIRAWRENPPQEFETRPEMQCTAILDEHSDWVNSLILCNDNKTLISAGSDASIKVWSLADNPKAICSILGHGDYVMALAYARVAEKIVSVSLDRSILIWDVNLLTSLNIENTTTKLDGQKGSIYSVATSPEGNIIVTGSTENMLRVWDLREQDRNGMELKGHTDNVRALAVSENGKLCVSGSSDATLKVWSLEQQECITTIKMPDSVWTLQPINDINRVLVGLKNGCVMMVDINTQSTREILYEKGPILNICFDPKSSCLWVSTPLSNVNGWTVDLSHITENAVLGRNESLPSKPAKIIEGLPRIKDFCIIKDRRHILTKNTDDDLQLWDVLYAKFKGNLGKMNMEEYKAKMERDNGNSYFVPNWFSVKVNTGFLTISLDEVDWNSAWILANQTNLPGSGSPSLKYNFGCLIIRALLKDFAKAIIERDKKVCENSQTESNSTLDDDFLELPGHTPIILSESGDTGVVYCRVHIRDVTRDRELKKLEEHLPHWALSFLLKGDLPAQHKMNFTVTPCKSVTQKPPDYFNFTNPTRLIGYDTVSIQKIIEYVYGEIAKKHNLQLEGVDPSDILEISCNDQILNNDMDMRSVKYQIWKKPIELKFEYRYKQKEEIETQPQAENEDNLIQSPAQTDSAP